MINDGKADCLYGIDESHEAITIMDGVRRNHWHLLMYLGDWRCSHRRTGETVSCQATQGQGPFLHSFPYVPTIGCDFGPYLAFWPCHEAGRCVREGLVCQLRTELRSRARCPRGYQREAEGSHWLCVRKICPQGQWPCLNMCVQDEMAYRCTMSMLQTAVYLFAGVFP